MTTLTQEVSCRRTAANDAIAEHRLKLFNSIPGPRVGDYLRFGSPHPSVEPYTRFTHDWGDHIQTSGVGGAYYYISPSGRMSFSGGLSKGVAAADIIPTEETREGSFWFFDEDIHGAGRAVNRTAPMRVYALRPMADLSNVAETKCPFWLTTQENSGRRDYKYRVERDCTAHVAFDLIHDLNAWLRANDLAAETDVTVPGLQRLRWTTPDKTLTSPQEEA
jgi:hypothetical protein